MSTHGSQTICATIERNLEDSMGRTIRFTNRADTFTQGYGENNIELTLFLLGGNDVVELDRSDELGGGNWVDMGAGNDHLTSRAERGNVFLLGDGNDNYWGIMGDDGDVRRADTVRGGAGNDFFLALTTQSRYSGGSGSDNFWSLGFKNRIDGGSGRDSVFFGVFDDSPGSRAVNVDLAAGTATRDGDNFETLTSIEDVIGTNEDDRILGSAVGNRILGSEGVDTLTGRGGADTFVWRTSDEAPTDEGGLERITDFRSAQGDRIDVRRVDANESSYDGNQAFAFIGYRGFTEKAGQLSAIRRGDDTVLRGDTDGDGIADFAIRLVGVSSLNRDDLVL
jgi:serralysin